MRKLLLLFLLLLADAVAQYSPSYYCTDVGVTDAYACSLSPSPIAYVTGAVYFFKANTSNTGAATINFNGIGAKTIVTVAGGVPTTLTDNYIRAGQVVEVSYDGTNMQIQSTAGSTPVLPGGSNTQCQYNNSGAFGGITGCTSDGTNLQVNIIHDLNGNPFITSSATASAVDSVTVTNAATANPATVAITASGSDSNISLSLLAKGTGNLNLGVGGSINQFGTATFTKLGAGAGVTASHTLDVWNATVTTGVTEAVIHFGDGQGSTSQFQVLCSDNSTPCVDVHDSKFFVRNTIGDQFTETDTWQIINNGRFITAGDYEMRNGVGGSIDTNISRISAGVIGAGTGSAGSTAGTFRGSYQSSDGSAGVTGATCSAWKNGLCTTP